MPLSEYFGGHGEGVMKEMIKKKGKKKGKQMFYATANKKKMAPSKKVKDKFGVD